MSVKLQKESIRLCEVVCSPYCQTTVEGDVIVPDVKPDIKKVLQVENSVVINHKNVQNDKIYVQGTVSLCILYLPDNDEEWCVKAIKANQEFNHAIDIKGAEPNMELCIDAEIEPSEFTLVNSRKLNLRSKVGLLARLSGAKEIEIASGLEGDDSIELKCRMMDIYNPRVDAVREIIVRERLEVPMECPPVCEILKFSAKPYSTELKLLDGMAKVKGEVKFSTLYCGDDAPSLPEVMEHTVMFSESLEIDGISEDMSGEIDYCVKDISCEISQDNDGDNKILNCEVVLSATVRAFETIKCNAILDAYGKTAPVELEKTQYPIERMLKSDAVQITANENVSIPDYLPRIKKLCDHSATPTIENVLISENSAIVSGYITTNFLYLSDDPKQPLSGFSHVIPFSHSFDIPGIPHSASCDARAEIEHISATISGDKSLNFRAIISIGIKAIALCSLDLVSKIDYCEDRVLPKQASMVVYFVQKGDTLWDIAKKYRTSPDAIVANNGSEAEILKPGKCIYIFK